MADTLTTQITPAPAGNPILASIQKITAQAQTVAGQVVQIKSDVNAAAATLNPTPPATASTFMPAATGWLKGSTDIMGQPVPNKAIGGAALLLVAFGLFKALK